MLVLLLPLAALRGYAQWSVVNGGVENGQVYTMLYIEDSATLVLGGSSRYLYSITDPINGVAYYNEGVWHPMGTGVTHSIPVGQVPPVQSICAFNGSLLVGGEFYAMDSVPFSSYVAQWDGDQWHSMGVDSCCQELSLVRSWRVLEENAHLCGWMEWTIDTVSFKSWATWDGEHWAPGDTNGLFPFGYSGQINQVVDYNGQRYVCGNFQQWNVPNDLAVLDGDTWEEVGPGIQGDAWVNDLEVFDGKLWVAGEFYSSAGNPATGLMTWDGTQWADPFPQIEFSAAGKELLVADGKLYFVGPFVGDGLTGQYRIGVFDGEQLCVLGGHLIQAYSIAASADTLYGFVYPEGWPMQQVAKWPLDAPPDTCYTIVQGVFDSQSLRPEFTLFPNPASEQITLRSTVVLTGDVIVRILDAAGRLVRTVNIQPSGRVVALSIEGMPPGCYQAVVCASDLVRKNSLPFMKVD